MVYSKNAYLVGHLDECPDSKENMDEKKNMDTEQKISIVSW